MDSCGCKSCMQSGLSVDQWWIKYTKQYLKKSTDAIMKYYSSKKYKVFHFNFTRVFNVVNCLFQVKVDECLLILLYHNDK